MNISNAVAPSVSVGRVLLVSNDPATLQLLTESMGQLALDPQICVEGPAALDLLNSQKFEAVVVDLLLGELAQSILETVRASRSNRTVVLFTVSGSVEGSAVAFKAGSSFVLERPLSAASINRTLKAAYGLIVRERRRYFRCPIVSAASIQGPDLKNFPCETINVSEGGMAVSMLAPLQAGLQVKVRFELPDRAFKFDVQSYVCWSDGKGKMGLQFVSPWEEGKSELQEWLSQKLEESLPESVAEKFRRTIYS
jgi:ActR/RegA family two-component response regulator